MKRLVVATVMLWGSMMLSAVASAASLVPAVLSTGDGSQNFGSAVAVGSGLIAVGAPQADVGSATDAGVIYVFSTLGGSGTPVKVATLRAVAPVDGAELGSAVAVAGQSIVAGAPGVDGARGAVEIFLEPAGGWRGTVRPVARLLAPDRVGGQLGTAVSITNSTIAAGAPGPSFDTAGLGTAWVFTRPVRGWEAAVAAPAELRQPQADAGAPLGSSVSFDGDQVIAAVPGLQCGADGDDGSGDAGGVAVFTRPQGGWRGVLTPSEFLSGANLGGGALVAQGNLLVSGDPDPACKYGPAPGTVSVYTRSGSTWSPRPLASLTDPAFPRVSDGFGAELAIADGAILADTASGSSLAIYSEPADGWRGVVAATDTLSLPSGTVAPAAPTLAVSGATALWDDTVLQAPTGWSRPTFHGTLRTPSGPGYSLRGSIASVVQSGQYLFGAAQDGSIAVFRRANSSWRNQTHVAARLLIPTRTPNTAYNTDTIAVTGSTAVVGVTGPIFDGPAAAGGRVYVFREPAGGWHGTVLASATLSAPSSDQGVCEFFSTGEPSGSPSGPGDVLFGHAVAVTTENIFVGSSCTPIGSHEHQGAVYVFSRPADGWSGTTDRSVRLTSPTGQAGDAFGSSLAIVGTRLYVGAPSDLPGGPGNIFVLTEPRGGWGLGKPMAARLTVPKSTERVQPAIGNLLATNGSTVFAPDIEGGDLAYVFSEPRRGWTGNVVPNATLSDPDSQQVSVVGRRVYAGDQTSNDSIEITQFTEPAQGWGGLSAPQHTVRFTPPGLLEGHDEFRGLMPAFTVQGSTAVFAGGAIFVAPVGGT
jgi:hypothetical protein